ncbi:MAG: hypothetical protein K6G42_10340 [Lachnospiraceae bacterium]|nr:hypothetical protein [Lachnospiraceae bacterium]
MNIKALRAATAVFAAALFSMLLILAVFFEAAETGHECCGEDCPICAFIAQCESVVHSLGSGISFFVSVSVVSLILSVFYGNATIFQTASSPVADKVRMND